MLIHYECHEFVMIILNSLCDQNPWAPYFSIKLWHGMNNEFPSKMIFVILWHHLYDYDLWTMFYETYDLCNIMHTKWTMIYEISSQLWFVSFKLTFSCNELGVIFLTKAARVYTSNAWNYVCQHRIWIIMPVRMNMLCMSHTQGMGWLNWPGENQTPCAHIMTILCQLN